MSVEIGNRITYYDASGIPYEAIVTAKYVDTVTLVYNEDGDLSDPFGMTAESGVQHIDNVWSKSNCFEFGCDASEPPTNNNAPDSERRSESSKANKRY